MSSRSDIAPLSVQGDGELTTTHHNALRRGFTTAETACPNHGASRTRTGAPGVRLAPRQFCPDCLGLGLPSLTQGMGRPGATLQPSKPEPPDIQTVQVGHAYNCLGPWHQTRRSDDPLREL